METTKPWVYVGNARRTVDYKTPYSDDHIKSEPVEEMWVDADSPIQSFQVQHDENDTEMACPPTEEEEDTEPSSPEAQSPAKKYLPGETSLEEFIGTGTHTMLTSTSGPAKGFAKATQCNHTSDEA